MRVRDDQRLETVSRNLDHSPALREAVAKAIADGRFGPAILGGMTQASIQAVGADADRLESLVATDRLEAIVRRVGRPPLIVRNDAVELEPLPDFPAGTDGLIKNVEPSVKSVGRVEFANYSMSWGGTGWVVDATGNTRVIATNRHVAKLVARRTSDGRGVFMRNPVNGALFQMSLDFKEEVDSQPGDAEPFKVTEIIYLADDTAPDVALLRITGASLPSPLDLAQTEAEADELVGLIGYPAYDPRNDADDQARYFRDLYEVKRFAPGRIMQALAGEIVLMHDCTSLGGNSGSPLIRLDGGKVVGLHYAGEYGKNNSAVGVRTLRDLIAGKRPVSVALGAAAVETVKDGVHKPLELAGRDGYDPAFLGAPLNAPWPNIAGPLAMGLARPSDATAARPFELRYTHFGVLFSEALRQPLIAAVNIDGAHSLHIKRTDKWFLDGRIPLDKQLSQKDFADLEIDRGHMVRREDANWDPAVTPAPHAVSALAARANQDTFHYTNAAPQHMTLNQGKRLWQGLENYILDNARTKGFKACVFTGPVIRDDDPEIEPGVRAPLEFWKLVAMVDSATSGLHATAYLLSQGQLIRDLIARRSLTEGVEGFVLGAYRTFQIAIGDLADATGYDFSSYLAADPLAKTKPGQEAVAAGAPLFVPLEEFEDIVT